MRIDRCLCFNRSFAELKQIAKAQQLSQLSELQQVVAFGHKCRLCHPYVRRMLQTGETVFSEILRADAP
ncbi:MAG: (2Fe-2S)-binding protein [Candidatus Melainabacteria bacterium HGW-Melainabacteria-1]|nr:MAG: (2Fe-2S)-binding protein [Candidatus Melainabacteria bacterium HGW-Melainabacteria-1]